MFFGSIPALVTPFAAGRVDEDAFRDLVDWQIAEGSERWCRAARPARAATLTDEEHRRVIAICVETARGPRAGDRRLRLEQYASTRSS